MKHCPAHVYFLCLLHLVIGITAFACGGSLMIAPDGSLLGINARGLLHTPFSNYFIPGLLLFSLIGVFPLTVLFGLIFKPEWKFYRLFNIYQDKHGAWSYSLFSGIILITWIIIQQAVTAYSWFQPLITAIGVLILIFTMLPVVMRHYTITGMIPQSKL